MGGTAITNIDRQHEINKCYGALTSIQEQLNTIVGETQDARGNLELVLSNLACVIDEITSINKQLEDIKNGKRP